MVAYVIAKCRECGHPLISHGERRQGKSPERVCAACEEHGGPCAVKTST